jgi:acetyl esterase/lipase
MADDEDAPLEQLREPVETAPGVVEQDVVYQSLGPVDYLARIYRPSRPLASTGVPTLLDAHGGAWTSGGRDKNGAILRWLASRGAVCASVDFRMPPVAAYPASVADLNLAMRWWRGTAAEFGGRSDRVGGIGTSTGAHQLLLNALRPDDARYAGRHADDPSPARLVDYLVLCWPIGDPSARYEWARAQGRASLVASHEAYWGTLEAMADGSPQRILDELPAMPTNTYLPAILVVQGSADENMPAGMSARLVDAYRRAGGSAALRTFAGERHGFITRDPASSASVEALESLHDFIVAQNP